jgi:ribosomal-protein-alanine N-acetyltransferase
MNQIVVRALESRDIDSILAIQSASPEIAQWTRSDYESVLKGEMSGWSCEFAALGIHAVAGFLVARKVGPDIEILNFAVTPKARRLGAGAALLKTALDWAHSSSAEQVILEVRSANEPALRFYAHHKFKIVGRRPNYYSSPADDALLLTLSLT